ncbi:disease resistance protein SUMM2-like [Neltuma alba]|uniref:disease resistance protein SUMM2-like n=1 Tax=Neltuma alba TaxID=207710 RepID=UPI0010A2CE8C|nr:disease resistance protein SUMM2-like [Prosopis alba]
MESRLLDLAKNEVQSLVNLVKNEAQYLCCFNSHVENFDRRKEILVAKHQDVKRKFQKGKGVFSFKYEARQWEHEADGIINIDTKIKKKFFFGWCPNCWWQYQRGKELAEETQHIEELLGRCNFDIVAGRANVSNIKHLSSQDFIHFKSRESDFQDLIEALHDENCTMVGLQGMGGVGKTSMAKEAGHKLEEFKLIDKIIFLVISKPPDFKKIRVELAKSLDLNLEEVKEEELSSAIWPRITSMNKKLLIILDDVWEKFDLLENLGIPPGHQHEDCNLLITTRNSHVCREMGCQRIIKLHTLSEKEAMHLFQAHASLNNSSRGLKGMPQKIVKHYGGVPIAIVAIARALKNQPLSIWKDALKTLEDRHADQSLEEAYKCLKLSYDNLRNQNAKELLLISSLFPEDFEIPIHLLTKIGIGLSSFNEHGKYHLTRSDVDAAIIELIDSSLLLDGRKECVKMHDLVREVSLRTGDKYIQSLIYLKMPIKENLRYLFWKNDDFLDEFDGHKLEVLLIYLDGSKELNVSNIFFKEVMSLKVLVLVSNYYRKRVPTLSLMNSLQPLKDIRTLILVKLDLGDISIVGNLLSLETLHFSYCSIIELPRGYLKLKNLRSLEVEECEIEKNNPFEVIERCSQLEELTFVGNECDDKEKYAISQNGSPLTLHRYCISSNKFSYYFEKHHSMSRCFQIDELNHLLSEATFKQLVRRAELLILEREDDERIRKSLIPDIIAVDEGEILNDLIVLHLSSCPHMECLIDTKDNHSGVTAFCNLAELHLSKMGVEDLCRGFTPSSFLEQLEIMKLKKCHRLKRILSDSNYNLCHLKSMELEDCPMLTSIFQLSTARSLIQLEELTIRRCSALEYIIVGEDSGCNQRSYHDSFFPKLKIIQIAGCNELRIILPILPGGWPLERINIRWCRKLKYLFDEFQEVDVMLPFLEKMELFRLPSLVGVFREYDKSISSSMQEPTSIPLSTKACSFSWVQVCCFKSKAASEEADGSVSTGQLLDKRIPQGLFASEKWIDTPPTLGRQLALHFHHIRKMELAYLSSNSVSTLFTLSTASKISWEELTITGYDGLKLLELHAFVSIDPQNYSLRGLSPRSIVLKSFLEFTRPFKEFLLCWHMKQQQDKKAIEMSDSKTLLIADSKITEIVDLTHVGVGSLTSSLQKLKLEYLREMVNICVGPKHVMCFYSLQKLFIERCFKLKFIFSASIVRSLPMLTELKISRCEELVNIVEEDYETNNDDHFYHEPCFPNLEQVSATDCDKLQYLLSITVSGILPKLRSLEISRANALEHVLVRQGEMKEMVMKDVLPLLSQLELIDLPNLVGLCHGIDFQILKRDDNIKVDGCSKFSFYGMH